MRGSRTYPLSESIVFHKTTAEYGGLSNMAAGYSLNINDVIIPTAEHLYQACRFPAHPDIQLAIINENSPMNAKWVGRKHIDKTRPDWEQVKFKVMQWVLEVKLSQNWETFGELLLSTGDKNIIELTNKDKVWGAKKEDNNQLVGVNALGRLLMDIRERYVKTNIYQRCIEPLIIPNFLLFGFPIEMVCNEHYHEEIRWSLSGDYSLT
jgi:ribA/ribD-fused uncharacterized protein